MDDTYRFGEVGMACLIQKKALISPIKDSGGYKSDIDVMYVLENRDDQRLICHSKIVWIPTLMIARKFEEDAAKYHFSVYIKLDKIETKEMAWLCEEKTADLLAFVKQRLEPEQK